MFKRLLVPLDGSALAEQAIPSAVRLAHATGGSILLVRAVNPLREFTIYPEMTITSQDIVKEEINGAAAYLSQIASSKQLAGIETHTAVLSGPIAASILDAAYEHQIDAIILCSHGRTGVKRWVLGSVAEEVVRHSSIPVLLLHEPGQKSRGLAPLIPHPIRVLVALDGSPLAEEILPSAIELAATISAPGQGALHLLRLIKLPTVEDIVVYHRLPTDVDARKVVLQQAGDYLDAVGRRLTQDFAATSVKITWSVEECENVAETLIQIAEQGKGIGTYPTCDMIALTTHGYNALQRWLVGSVTERLLEHSSLPLLVIHPQTHAADEGAPEHVVALK